MPNCNEDMIFYVPVNSKVQHTPRTIYIGIFRRGNPHPIKGDQRPFSSSILKKIRLLNWNLRNLEMRFLHILTARGFCRPFHSSDNVTNGLFFLKFLLRLDLRNLRHDFDPGTKLLKFCSNSHPPVPYSAEFLTAILERLGRHVHLVPSRV